MVDNISYFLASISGELAWVSIYRPRARIQIAAQKRKNLWEENTQIDRADMDKVSPAARLPAISSPRTFSLK